MRVRPLRFESRSDEARALREAFFTTYFARLGAASAGRVPLQAALIHLKRACKRYRWRDEPGWQQDVRLELRRGEEYLAWHEQAPSGIADGLAGQACGQGA